MLQELMQPTGPTERGFNFRGQETVQSEVGKKHLLQRSEPRLTAPSDSSLPQQDHHSAKQDLLEDREHCKMPMK